MLVKEFEYILAVADCGTISKAAEKLYISQPALTKYIHSLEESLNIKLFERVGRRLCLTSFGQTYVETARKIVGICDELEYAVYASDDMLRGTLRIGSGRRGAYILPNVIPAFSKRFPSVELKMVETSYEELESMLIQGQLDIGILKEPSVQRQSFMESELLFEEELVLVTPAGHHVNSHAQTRQDASYPWLDLRELNSEVFILYKPEHKNRIFIDQTLMESGVEAHSLLETNNVDGMLHLVSNGYGVCFAPEMYARNLLESEKGEPSVCVFSVGTPVQRYKYYACRRKNSSSSRYVNAFIQLLKDYFRPGDAETAGTGT